MVQHFPQTEAAVADQEKPSRTALVEIALYLLVYFLALFSFAAAFRYGLALYGRGHLLPALLAGISDILLAFAFWACVVVSVATGAALAWWLWAERGLAYAANNRAEPRHWWEVLSLALLPLVNLVSLGVLLEELLAEHLRSGRRDWRAALRSWWIWWGLGHLAVLGFALWSLDRSVQARTEALLLGALLGGVLLVLVLRTRGLVAEIGASRSPRGTDGEGKPARWVIAVEAPSVAGLVPTAPVPA